MENGKELKVILLGQAAFGGDVLNALHQDGTHIAGVITVPESKPAQPVVDAATKLGIPVLRTHDFSSPDVVNWIKSLNPDLFVLAFVTDFIPLEVIGIATHGGINYHPSLLPKYRGSSAMNWTVINGEEESGVTVHFIDDGLDTGPILLQEKVAIDLGENVKNLYFQKLYPLGVAMMARAVSLIREGSAQPVPQDHSRASFQLSIKEKDALIDWSKPQRVVHNLIRGCNPNPGAYTYLQGAKLKIWEAEPYPCTGGDPGLVIKIMEEKGFCVSTSDGAIMVKQVQYENGPKVAATELAGSGLVRVGLILGE
ncbi:MAG: methionyl-tRNA formyltransferase [Bacillota bacterium]